MGNTIFTLLCVLFVGGILLYGGLILWSLIQIILHS